MSIHIPCPQCGTELKLRDRSLIGKTGKCPKCRHRFPLLEPDEVKLELASEAARKPAPNQAVVGTGAKWVPDGTVATPAAPPPAAAEPAAFPPLADVPPPNPRRQRAVRRKQVARLQMKMYGGAALAVVVIGAGLFFALQGGGPEKTPGKPNRTAAGTGAEPVEVADSPADGTAGTTPAAKRNPINLKFIPAGARIIVNLRPAELWKAGGLGEGELMAATGDGFNKWLTQTVTALCKEEPANIEELLIAFIGGGRTQAPDIAVVVHLKEAAKKSDLLEKFGGEQMEENGQIYYISGEKAVLLDDLKTYAICPKEMGGEMAAAASSPSVTDIAVEELLPETDRGRMFSIVFIPQDIQLEAEFLAAANVQPFLMEIVNWLSNDGEVEGVVWSVDLGEKFRSEILLRNNQTVARPNRVRDSFKKKLQQTPKDILATIEMMNPTKFGYRRVIGRVPAMSQMYAMNTQVTAGERTVSLVTELDERAAPNIALGTLLAWDESTRTDFGGAKPTTPTDTGEEKVPELVADRFKTKIDVDFRREPLFSAFNYIGEEAKFKVDLDGDALKDAGYTQNMPQTFKMDAVPAGKAIQEILKAYDKMCVVIDESKKVVTVTTFKFAEVKKQTPVKF